MSGKKLLANLTAGIGEIYNLRDDRAKGRLISLFSALITSFYNVFITGVFYTGFLSAYGISITDFGIISFIPYIGNCFSVFSGKILSHFQKRKRILLGAKLFYYAMYILGVTLMPQIVQDQRMRMYAFVGILFVAHAVYALFSPGLTTWFYNFYPTDTEHRTRYIMLNQIFSSVMSCFVLFFSSILTDAVAGSSHQITLILLFRYVAFALVVVDIAMQARAKEYAYPESKDIRLRDVFTKPLRYRKFMYCMLLMFFFSFINNFNNGLWTYHLLNHLQLKYTTITTVSMLYTLILITTAPVWQRLLRNYSWIKTYGIANLIWVPTEVFFFLMNKNTLWIFLPNSIFQSLCQVGINLASANVLYMNLPSEDSTTHIAFNTIGCNVFAFLGLLVGTWTAGLSGDTPFSLWGMQVYSVQFTTLMRAVTQLGIGLLLTMGWRIFTSEKDIAEIESRATVERVHRMQMRKLWKAKLQRTKRG